MNFSIETLERRQLLSADLTGVFLDKIPIAIPLQATNHLTVRITNQGDATATGVASVLLYASTDAVLDPGDTLLSTTSAKLNLKTSKSSNVTLKFTSPATLPTGGYFLIADIIGGSTIIEDNTTNDVFASSSAVTITAPFVDLTDTVTLSPKAISYTVGGKKQTPVKLTVVVTNSGNVSAKGPIGISVFGSNNQTLDAQDALLLTLPAKPINIKPSKTKVYAVAFKPSVATPSGTFYVIAQINPGAGIFDSNSTNNSAATGNQLTIFNSALPISPKLVGGLTANSTTVLVGTPQQVTFTATVADETSTTAVEVDEVDALGNPISKITELFDNGLTANGDAIEGDGVFSGVISISFDSPRVRYFVATLTDPISQSSGHTVPIAITGI